VVEFLNHIKVNPDQGVLIERLSENVAKVPENTTYKSLFTDVLDVFGRPGRRFYDFLSICAQDEREKAELKHLLTKSGKPELKNFVDETATYADLI